MILNKNKNKNKNKYKTTDKIKYINKKQSNH